MTTKTVLMVTNLDTRGAEFAQVRDLVVAQGLGPALSSTHHRS